jgi:tyrosine-protein kinase Etk/Wzc
VEVDWQHSQILADKDQDFVEIKGQVQHFISWKTYYRYAPGAAGEEIDLSEEAEISANFQEFTEHPLLKIKVTLTKNVAEGEVLIIPRTKGSLLSEYTGDNFQVFAVDQVASVLGLTLNTPPTRRRGLTT